MPRGNTATIDFATLRMQWESHSSMASICTYWTITKDQLIRLRDVLPLPKRHDRRFRFKPKRSEYRDPTPDEIRAGCLEVQAMWDERTEIERRVQKPQAFQLRTYEMPGELQERGDFNADWMDGGAHGFSNDGR